MFGLEHIIAPISTDDFLESYWGEKALYIPGAADKFQNLFGWDDINHILNHGRPSFEGIRLVYEKQSLPQETLQSLPEWLTKGATLIVNALNQIDPVVGRFASMLSRDLNTHVNINSYASCPAKQGFDTHYDRHDVFIVQVAGTKKWAVLEPTVKWPLERQTFSKGEAPDVNPYIECEMSEGDVLYIPRGHWHYAVAVTPSIHFTVGPQSRSGIDFLMWLTNQLMNNEEFLRKDFPVACINELGGSRSDEDFHVHVESFRQHMTESFQGEGLKEAIVQFCMTSNPLRRTYQFPDMALLQEEIRPQTEFRMAPEQKAVVRYDETSKHAEILIRGHILKLDKISPGVLGTLLDRGGTLKGAELVAASDSDEWEPIKSFLLLMYERGVIQLVNTESAQPSDAQVNVKVRT